MKSLAPAWPAASASLVAAGGSAIVAALGALELSVGLLACAMIFQLIPAVTRRPVRDGGTETPPVVDQAVIQVLVAALDARGLARCTCNCAAVAEPMLASVERIGQSVEVARSRMEALSKESLALRSEIASVGLETRADFIGVLGRIEREHGAIARLEERVDTLTEALSSLAESLAAHHAATAEVAEELVNGLGSVRDVIVGREEPVEEPGDGVTTQELSLRASSIRTLREIDDLRQALAPEGSLFGVLAELEDRTETIARVVAGLGVDVLENRSRFSAAEDRVLAELDDRTEAMARVVAGLGVDVLENRSRFSAAEHRVLAKLETAGRALDESAAATADLASGVRVLREDSRLVRATVKNTYGRVVSLAALGDQMPSQVLELTRLHRRLVVNDRPMPALGGWSASVATISALVEVVRDNATIRTIVECGSGASTVWQALALAERGIGGHIVSLDHDVEFADVTRSSVELHGVSDLVEVRTAPLEHVVVADYDGLWYPPSALSGLDSVDLLFIDGPPASTAEDVRFPAYPLMADRLSDGALVILDDTVRDGEKQILERWLSLKLPNRQLRLERVVGRSTVCRVEHS